ncbi:hypothetical protein [Pedobacter sp. SYP-B3415]|uniref:hypothetical protein n=1 Tax=Pedobacter sp. SYP-B3415 TaxID=2496641 RepID=UPI00101D5DDF|nr:hypothetical protein [Pedobacter sp. SYP-B3415]
MKFRLPLFTKPLAAALLGAAVLTSSGCATIFGRSNYDVTISSNPVGSNLSITDKKGKEIYRGVTPATLKLKSSAGYFSKAEYQLKFNKDGFEEQVIPLTCKLNGWYFGNLLIGGIVGMLIIDPASGAMYTLPERNINQTLQPKQAQTATLQILDYNNLSAFQQAQLQKIK